MKEVKWGFEISAERVFDFFKHPPVEDLEIKRQRFEPEKLKEMLIEEHGFSDERIESTLKKLEESQKNQSSLGKFFG